MEMEEKILKLLSKPPDGGGISTKKIKNGCRTNISRNQKEIEIALIKLTREGRIEKIGDYFWIKNS